MARIFFCIAVVAVFAVGGTAFSKWPLKTDESKVNTNAFSKWPLKTEEPITRELQPPTVYETPSEQAVSAPLPPVEAPSYIEELPVLDRPVDPPSSLGIFRLKVSGMNPVTSTKVEGALREFAGVWQAYADWKPGNIEVHYDPKEVTSNQMEQAVEELGFLVESSELGSLNRE